VADGPAIEERLRDVPFEALAGRVGALEPALAQVLAGEAAERVLDRFLRSHPELDAAGRAACAEAVFGVGLWRRRLRSALCGAPGSPRLLLALLLRDLAGRDDAAALAGVAMADLPPLAAPPAGLADRHSLPDWLAAELVAAAGEEAGALAAALNRPGPVALRANRLRGDRGELAAALALEGVATRPSLLARDGLVVTSPRANIRGLAAWREGRCEVQDEGSQLLALALGARPGERLLDRCAGAGGKALALASAVGTGGRVLACDADAARLDRLMLRAERAGAGAIVSRLGAAPPPGLQVDGALVDAPCSELGPLRRGPDLRWRLDPRSFAALPALQLSLLRDAAAAVRPGGRLVYATCTFRREENQGVALAFEAAEPGWRRVSPAAPAGLVTPDLLLQLMPHRHGTDGFFAAAWERTLD
jgi:16S rRNA (cytosine967-C5)-methyltransferase